MYLKQLEKSLGFDIDVYLIKDSGVVKPMFNDKSPISAEIYYRLSDCSRIAVDAYNQQEGTDYSVNRVVKSCTQPVNAGQMYFITFEGKNSENLFKVFQAMVYHPVIRAKEVVLVRPKAAKEVVPVSPEDTDVMPSDKSSNVMKDLFTPPRDSHHAAELWETYLKQIKETEGFDIDVYPTNAFGVIKPIFNDTSPVSAETYYMLSNFSRISVDAYNQREGTDYTVNRVVKVCTQVDCGTMYFITFEAKFEDHFQVFQAITGANKVLLVRPKAMVKDLFMSPRESHHDAKHLEKYGDQIRETEGFDIDVYPTNGCGVIKPMFNDTNPVSAETYYMLSDFSRISVDAYNQREGTDYTVNRVVKVCTQVDCGTMYFITFEAKFEDHFQVFQAITGANKVLLVRPKAMVKDLFMSPRESHHDAKHLEKYGDQIRETEGFDIDVYPTNGCGVIKPMFNDTNPVSAETYYMLSDCSRIAVDAYNKRQGSDYTVNLVVKSCIQTVKAGQMYFITFQAINSKDHLQVFQAMVYLPVIGKPEVVLVRPKSMDILTSYKRYYMMKNLPTPPCDASGVWETYLKQIKETEGFDIDVYPANGCGVIKPMFNDTSSVSTKTYYMLSDCSRIAVDAYNVQEDTHYTLYQVVKVCTQTFAAGQMYFITFEAISNDGLQVLQAKVFKPPKGPNEVLLVRLKA